MTRVTVAVPVWNGLPFLRPALESVLNQTHRDLDVVVLDNASSDGTAEYVEAIGDPRVHLIRNDTNIGLDGNWNKALRRADRSPYFKLMCADDVLRPDAVATEASVLDANPNVVMTASQRQIIGDDGKTIIPRRGLAGFRGVVDGRKALRWAVALGSNVFGEPTSVMLRSSVIPRAGGFDNTHHYCIDFDFWTRILLLGDLYAIRQPLAAFRVGSASNSVALARRQRTETIGELRKLASDDQFGVNKPTLWSGIAAAIVMTEARLLLYKLLAARSRSQSTLAASRARSRGVARP
jgi:GT2 family glycosyltransferase